MSSQELKGLRLLVVEDEPIVRRVIALTARDCGIEVDQADNGERATAVLADSEYDIVITDLRMPGMSGLELMDWVGENHPGTALILITGFALDDAEERVAKFGGILLHKPFDRRRLLAALNRAQQGDALSTG